MTKIPDSTVVQTGNHRVQCECISFPVYILTKSKASIELQVSGEQSGQTAEQFAAGLPSVQLIAAVDQTVGWGAIVSFVQNPHQQLAFTNHYLGTGQKEEKD